MSDAALTYPMLDATSVEPTFDDPADERLHRQRQCALGYRAFASQGWGSTGDGHISVRDPERADCFWLLRLGVPFSQATVGDMVLVGPDGDVVDTADGTDRTDINKTAYYIHMPIHDVRPDVMCVAHTHTAYGTPWSAMVQPYRAISQEACSFVFNQSVYHGEEVGVGSYETGTKIAEAVGSTRLCFLRNHGLLTMGGSVAEAVGFYVMAERVAEVHIKAPAAVAISDEGAKMNAEWADNPAQGWWSFQYLTRTVTPDPSVVG